jgi:hypothetical protein
MEFKIKVCSGGYAYCFQTEKGAIQVAKLIAKKMKESRPCVQCRHYQGLGYVCGKESECDEFNDMFKLSACAPSKSETPVTLDERIEQMEKDLLVAKQRIGDLEQEANRRRVSVIEMEGLNKRRHDWVYGKIEELGSIAARLEVIIDTQALHSQHIEDRFDARCARLHERLLKAEQTIADSFPY